MKFKKENLVENQVHPRKSGLSPHWAYRRRAFTTILRMGHCAPAVMQTILDVSSKKKEWLVRLSAGMPGGIGNTGFECGAVTAPLVLFGFHDGLDEVDRGLPVIFDRGHTLCHNFLTCYKTLHCREIRGRDRFPKHCLGPVTRSPELFLAALEDHHQGAIPAVTRSGYSRLYAYLVENEFHCAQAVFIHLGYTPTQQREVFAAASAFMGGTLFLGNTCSAFTAGVMAIGLRNGEIEDSFPRVMRMLAIMTAGGNAFDERINNFNRSMNRGHRLAKWFIKEFGSTQCQAITQCDFSNSTGVSTYVEGDRIVKCRTIAGKVADKVQMMLG
jgi:hypothetical protein